MKRRDLAQNLAYSLTLADWSKETIQASLERRLPQPLHALSGSLADSLIDDMPFGYAPSPKAVAQNLQYTAEFQNILRYCQRNNNWPNPDLSSPKMAPSSAFADLLIPQLATVDALSDWLLTPLPRLNYLADLQTRYENQGDTQVNHYHYNLLAKAGGGHRLIEAPKANLKALQRRILDGILSKVPVHPDAYAYAQGRNCLQAAGRHAGEQMVVAFDLANFFPSISAGRIHGLFRCLGYPHGISRYLTGLCTNTTPNRVLNRLSADERSHYRGPHLPQGAPSSPALANLACHGLDRRLSKLAASVDARYSRYADDLSFSGDASIAPLLTRLVPVILRKEGFQTNSKKTRVMARTSRQIVTGVVVNQHMNIRRETFDHLKAVIHACGHPDDPRLKDAAFRASLMGQIDWVTSVNRARGEKLKSLMAKTVERRRSG